MLSRLTTVLVITIILFLPSDVLCNICSLSFCNCEDSDLSCHGEDREVLDLSSSSLPTAISTISLSNMATVIIKTNTFSDQEELKELSLENIEKVVLKEVFYSASKPSSNITHFKMENIKQLEMESGKSFNNFPQCSQVVFKNVGMKTVPTGGLKLYSDTMRIEDCDIGDINREGIQSGSQTFIFINNKVGIIKTSVFSGSSNMFNFSGNDIRSIESNAISVSFLSSDISRNTFHSSSTRPLLSLAPSPACVPDETAYDYADSSIEYRIVASPALTFQANYFPQFSLAMLDLPAIQNIPLGSLTISSNIVPCHCQTVQELAVLADFDHLDLQGEGRRITEFGDLVFKKEFYSSSMCVMENGKEMSLKKFARSWLEVTETEIKCTDPVERKKRLSPNKLVHGDNKAPENTKNAVLADEPHSEKVKEVKKENTTKAHNNSNKVVATKADSSTASAFIRNTLLLVFVTLLLF